MKTVHLVIGIVLLLFALGSWVGAGAEAGATCANSQLGADLTGAPLCSSTAAAAVGLGVVGLVFLVISIVLFVTGREKTPMAPPTMGYAAPPQMGYAAPIQVCLKCGTQRMSAAPFCPSCGTPYPGAATLPPPPPPPPAPQ